MIRIEDFSFTYENAATPALDSIDLTVPPGEFLGVAGAVGSGRTTLFRVLNGSAPRHFKGTYRGRALVGGIDACEAGHAEIGAFTSSIFDDPDAQIVSLTAEEEVGFALVQRGVPLETVRSRVREALTLVGLAGFERRTTSSLSGGQKQRLVIASALALAPRLLLLDECASALDPRGARELYALMASHCRAKGVTVVAVERDLELLLEYADRILVLKDGGIALDAKPGEIVSHLGILGSAGVRIPVWIETVAILAERGLIREPFPESEAEATAAVSGLLLGAAS